MEWLLAVHGGAKEIEPEEEKAHREGCRLALQAGRAVLERGGSALDAVEASVRALEADPTFNAGTGSALNADGEVEMCAALMSGIDLRIGAVGTIRGVRHPVGVARLVMEEERAILLAGEGARRFAAEKGAELCEPEDLIVEERRLALAAHDTVGAVARDRAGNLAAATSTGGLPGIRAGRMGDSALPGCGYYADNQVGAVALSGDGETIARLTVASGVMRALETEEPTMALEAALSRLPDLGGEGGGIAISARGEVGSWHNSSHFAFGVATARDPEGQVRLSKDEQ
jgi:beta-aspartyl-peptidase (threonine type)